MPAAAARLEVVSGIEGDTLGALEAEYRASLQAERRSVSTIRSYMDTYTRFERFLAEQGQSTDVRRIKAASIESYVNARLAQIKPISAAIEYRALRRQWAWLLRRGLVTKSPFTQLRQPKVEDTMPPVLSIEEMQKLLASIGCRVPGKHADHRCQPNKAGRPTFRDVRDRTIVLLLLDTGMRRGEVCSITRDGINWQDGTVLVSGKTGPRRAPFASSVMESLLGYDRRRKQYVAEHPSLADEPAYFVGPRGALTASGLSQLFAERTVAAFGKRLGVHITRHTRANEAYRSGIPTPDVEAALGWKPGSPMASRYARGAAADRARVSFQQKSLGDQLG